MTQPLTPANGKRIAYCIFDMDGLLIDTETVYTRVTNDILARFGLAMSWEIKQGLMGKPALPSAEYLFSCFPEGSIPADYTPQMYLDERTKLQDAAWRVVPPMAGAVELVARLKEHGVPIAIATGSSDVALAQKTSHLPFISLFPKENIITSTSAPVAPSTVPTKGKPNPDIFLAAARSLGFDVGTEEEPATDAEREARSLGLVFEDAPLGVQAAKRANMNVVWVPDAELLALESSKSVAATQILNSLVEFDLASWGLGQSAVESS